MNDQDPLARRFEESRSHLRGVAYRMLGSLNEAEDAVQESWVHASRSDLSEVANFRGWMTTVVARICLDMLRARKARPDDVTRAAAAHSEPETAEAPGDPEQEVALADSVGVALLVVLETLAPAERLAFVLHDIFDLPFDEIAPIVGRAPDAARQLASRARRRVRGEDRAPSPHRAQERAIVDAFLAASQRGDFDALVAVLDPDVTLRTDRVGPPPHDAREARGAAIVARRASFGARGRGRFARVMLVNGSAGVVYAPRGRLGLALCFAFSGGKISAIDVVADAARLQALDLALLE